MRNLLLIVILTFVVLSCKKATEPEEVKEENVPFEFMDGNDVQYFKNTKIPYNIGFSRNLISFVYDSIVNEYKSDPPNRIVYFMRERIYDVNFLRLRNFKDYDSIKTKLPVAINNKLGVLQRAIDENKIDSLFNYLKFINKSLIIIPQETGFVISSLENCKGCLNANTEKLYLSLVNRQISINITHRYHYRFGRDILTPPILVYYLLIDNKYLKYLDNIKYNQKEVYYADPKE